MSDGFRGPHADAFTYVGKSRTPERHALAVATVHLMEDGTQIFIGAPDQATLLAAWKKLNLGPVDEDRLQDVKIYPQRPTKPYVLSSYEDEETHS